MENAGQYRPIYPEKIFVLGDPHEFSLAVKRFFYPNVHNGKQNLPRLNAISNTDISIIDQLMTKYSAFDHSHSIEAPVSLPEIDDIKADLRMLLEWSTDFKNHCEEEEEKAKGKK